MPDVLGIVVSTLRFATIDGAFGLGEVVILIFAKTVLTALCIGAGFSGGAFSPSLLIGSLIGVFFWTLTSGIAGVPGSGAAIYAISSMMGFASAVIGAPLTCILIVFELTRNYDVTIAAMVAVVFSNLVSHRAFGRSLFDVQLARRGIDFSLGRDRPHLAALKLVDYLQPEAVSATADDLSDDVAEHLHEGGREAVVLDPQGRLVGVFTPGTHRGLVRVEQGVVPARLVFHDNTSLAEAMERLRGFVGDAVPVVSHVSGKYLGAVSEADLVSAWLDEAARLQKEENASI